MKLKKSLLGEFTSLTSAAVIFVVGVFASASSASSDEMVSSVVRGSLLCDRFAS